MKIRDRIKELRRVRASELRPHRCNWRVHPDSQQNALRGVLAEVGYADALLARELEDGSLELIDGHLRASTTPDQEVPVLVLDVSEEEAALVLATHDPLAALAVPNPEQFDRLLAEIDTENEAVGAMLDDLVEPSPSSKPDATPPEVKVPEAYQVVVECDDETQQRRVYEQMSRQGYKCRVLTL